MLSDQKKIQSSSLDLTTTDGKYLGKKVWTKYVQNFISCYYSLSNAV
jgi:hypothetical protein